MVSTEGSGGGSWGVLGATQTGSAEGVEDLVALVSRYANGLYVGTSQHSIPRGRRQRKPQVTMQKMP